MPICFGNLTRGDEFNRKGADHIKLDDRRAMTADGKIVTIGKTEVVTVSA